jgi:hypothetical protein
MGVALCATGFWMYLDVPWTPNAVVVSVIIYNAAFGYRYDATTLSSPAFSQLTLVGAQYHGYIPLRSVPCIE